LEKSRTYNKKKIKKYWQYNLPTFGTVNEKVLPIGWNSSCPPKLDRLCDWNKCTLSSEASGSVLSCDHGYHTECFSKVNQKCLYCYKYLCDGIKDNCKIFLNMLNKKFNDNKDNSEDLKDQVNLQDNQDNDIDEVVSADESINSKLEEALELFKLC
jgi:hypothetical protein